MDEAKWEQWGALAGIVFVVLTVVASLIGRSSYCPGQTLLAKYSTSHPRQSPTVLLASMVCFANRFCAQAQGLTSGGM